MILGIGVDTLKVERMARACEKPRFVERVFLPGERERIQVRGPETAAGIFCAKEAAMKALGTGMRVGFSSIEVAKEPSGKPTLRFHGAALARAEQMGVTDAHLSISHEREMAIAMVILEGRE